MRNFFFRSFLFALSAIPIFCYADGPLQVKAAIQISSTISDGKYSLYQIAKIAKDNGIEVVVFTDKGFMRWEYGLWPLRNIIKKTVVSNSINRYGPERYLKDITELENKFSKMVFIPGVDSSPFYYWRGSLFLGNLTICNWHKQLIAIGLDRPSDYNNLPVMGNPKALRGRIDILKLWPLIILLAGLFLFKRQVYSYKDANGKDIAVYSKKLRIAGIVIIVLSGVFFINNWPPLKVKFDAYHGNLEKLPYQNFIDYVNKKGGLVFWTHPEAENISYRGKVRIETKKYPQALLYTHRYAGFTIFPAGYREVGEVGGIWDTLLKEYCSGKRKRPVWAVGALAFDQNGELSKRIRTVSTVVLCKSLNRKEIIKSFKEGKMYVLKGEKALEFILDEFSIEDKQTGRKVTFGEGIKLKGRPIIHIKGHFAHGNIFALKLILIRNGSVIKIFNKSSPFDFTYEDQLSNIDKGYYRLEIRSQGLILVTNPIFVN